MIYYFEGGHIKGQNSKIMIKFFDKLYHLIETFEFENQSMRKRELLKKKKFTFPNTLYTLYQVFEILV